mmetsp:Transcript_33337/g.59699  ORF Transcript_33337/g.59699 Transcript_33337/m.59699 type:complete len:275 (+) Transcript_33337:3646-4470(+)
MATAHATRGTWVMATAHVPRGTGVSFASLPVPPQSQTPAVGTGNVYSAKARARPRPSAVASTTRHLGIGPTAPLARSWTTAMSVPRAGMASTAPRRAFMDGPLVGSASATGAGGEATATSNARGRPTTTYATRRRVRPVGLCQGSARLTGPAPAPRTGTAPHAPCTALSRPAPMGPRPPSPLSIRSATATGSASARPTPRAGGRGPCVTSAQMVFGVPRAPTPAPAPATGPAAKQRASPVCAAPAPVQGIGMARAATNAPLAGLEKAALRWTCR